MSSARDELAVQLKQHAYLEGDFLLRSGKRSKYYLDKYRFETRPELLEAIDNLGEGRPLNSSMTFWVCVTCPVLQHTPSITARTVRRCQP